MIGELLSNWSWALYVVGMVAGVVVVVTHWYLRWRCAHDWKKAEVWCHLKELGGHGDALDKVLLVLRKCTHCRREEAWVESMTKRVKVKPGYARSIIIETYGGSYLDDWGREEW